MTTSTKDKFRKRITRKPSFASKTVKTDSSGNPDESKVIMSMQVDGKEYTTEAQVSSANPVEDARKLAASRMVKKLESDPATAPMVEEIEAEMMTSNNQFQSGVSDKAKVFYELTGVSAQQVSSGYRSSSAEMKQEDFGTIKARQSAANTNSESQTIDPESDPDAVKKAQSEREPLSSMVHHRSEKQKNHLPWGTSTFGDIHDGTGPMGILEEPVPEYFTRPDEIIYQGPNNTAIVLGRDRAMTNQMKFSPSVETRNYVSGFSDYMCAGAIDIVVGRMAPYPVSQISGLGGKFKLAPMFNTLEGEGVSKMLNIKLLAGQHPGIAMDSARIYISQMTDVDRNFKISTYVSTTGYPQQDHLDFKSDKQKIIPTSAIVLKADRLRFHSRQDIKIVTGGTHETYNSLGNRITQNNGVHIMAENGIDKNNNMLRQQPMVLGDNLVKYLNAVQKQMADLASQMDAFIERQSRLNKVVANTFHLLPIPGATDVGNPYTKLAGIIDALENLINGRMQQMFIQINNFTSKTNYLYDSGENHNFILSRFNTVN